MKNSVSLLVLLLFLAVFFPGCQREESGDTAAPLPYASTTTSEEAVVFSSQYTQRRTAGVTFTPDSRTVYFMLTGEDGRSLGVHRAMFDGDKWSDPELANFSGKHGDYDPFVSPDGKRLYFTSDRPNPGEQETDSDIWYVELVGDGWSEPVRLPEPVNTDRHESYPTVAADGTIYFGSNRGNQSGESEGDIYRARLVDGTYQVEELDDAINSRFGEWHAYIAPDQSYLVFTSHGREGGFGRDDLYVSFYRNGGWTKAANLGEKVNGEGFQICPAVSPDGRYLFFTAPEETAGAAVYQIDLESLPAWKP